MLSPEEIQDLARRLMSHEILSEDLPVQTQLELMQNSLSVMCENSDRHADAITALNTAVHHLHHMVCHPGQSAPSAN